MIRTLTASMLGISCSAADLIPAAAEAGFQAVSLSPDLFSNPAAHHPHERHLVVMPERRPLHFL